MKSNEPLSHLNRERLAKSIDPLILRNPGYRETPQPVLWLVAYGFVTKTKDFYRQVAHHAHAPYVPALPVAINNTKSIANKVGSEIMSKYIFFPFFEHDMLTIATPDPTQAETMIKNTLPFFAEKPNSIRVVITPIQEVRKAILYSTYPTGRQEAETKLYERTPHLSSYQIFNNHFYQQLAVGTIIFFVLLVLIPHTVILTLYILINLFYFITNPIKFVITTGGFVLDLPHVSLDELNNLPVENMPDYTIFVPLKNEHTVARGLLSHLRNMNYPPDKLDIKIVVEVTDELTIESIEKELSTDETSPDSVIFDLIKVPVGTLSTKPRSLNFAIQFARGSMCVIYDAEDRPDLNQLKISYLTFMHEKLDTLCVQGKLNYYNSRQNLLTRFFSLEYSYWFDFLLPGLQLMHIPLPLGGTSNHFLIGALKKVGGWDPYNVTEDADLGWRLSRKGYHTSMMHSYTLEEASSRVWPWIKQRTRWQKGFLMTLLVHLRTPGKMWHELGPWGFCSSILLFTTNFFLPVINPLLWLFFLVWYVPLLFGITYINFPVPQWLEFVGLVNLFFGNGVYMLTHAVGAMKLKRYDLLVVVPFLPFYWFLLSFASYRAMWQILRNPYTWEKTTHGLGK